jgi:uncharacterized protein
MFSKKWLVLFSIVIISLFIAGFTVAIPKESSVITTEETRIINVNGVGSVRAKPDMCIVSLGVVSEGKEAKESQNENSRISNLIIEALKKLEIKEEDIQTVEYSVNPIYKYEDGRTPVISGYQTVQMFSVKVYDLTKSGIVIDNATEVGANRINGVSFDIKDKDAMKLRAIEAAVKDARIKADTALAASSEKVMELINMNVNDSMPSTPVPMRGVNDASGKEAAQVMAGQMEIIISVNASYSF